MKKIIETREYAGNYRVNVFFDDDPLNPRVDYDGNLMHIVTSNHIRYNLGDEQVDDLDEELRRLVCKYVPWKDIYKLVLFGWRNDNNQNIRIIYNVKEDVWELQCYRTHYGKNGSKVTEWVTENLEYHLRDFTDDEILYYASNSLLIDMLEPYMVIHPVSIYDHSGVTIWLGNPTDLWDSGCIGFAYLPMDDMKQTGYKPEEYREKAYEIMESEMKEYDQFVRGEVYAYEVQKLIDPDEDEAQDDDFDMDAYVDDENNWENIASCYGFICDIEEVFEDAERYIPID